METQDPSGQKLRWWTQETTNPTTPHTPQPPKANWYNKPLEQVVAAPPVVIPPVVKPAPAPTELWEQLEVEARHRALLEEYSVAIEGNTRQIIATTRKRWAYTVLPAILLCAAIMIGIQSWSLLPMIGFLVAEVLLLDWMVRSMYKKGTPRMSLSPLGMTLDMPRYTLGPIFWDEIKTVKVKRFIYGSYVEVTLKDQKATYARALRTNGNDGKSLTWLLRKSKSLTLMDTVFSTPAKEIAAQIAHFRPDLVEAKNRR